MGCSFSSGLNALYNAVTAGETVWINENRFKHVEQLDLLICASSSSSSDGGLAKKIKHSSHLPDDGTYAMKKVSIQNDEQLELVREEIHVSSLFSHPNLLPLLDHAIVSLAPFISLSGFLLKN